MRTFLAVAGFAWAVGIFVLFCIDYTRNDNGTSLGLGVVLALIVAVFAGFVFEDYR